MFRGILLSACLSLFAKDNAQAFNLDSALKHYQSQTNSLYWKNRIPHAGYWQQDVAYDIEAQLNQSTEIITGHETLIYTNNSPDTIYTLYFRLIQNAFQPGSYKDEMEKGGKVFNTFGKYEKDKLGTIVSNLKIDGIATSFTVDNTILIVKLEKPLLPNQNLNIEMDFKTHFDQGSMGRRMKKFEHNNVVHFDGVHWYPRISVYDRKFKWTTDQHLGKEFYGDYGVYHVKLNLPNHYICEATGNLMNKDVAYADGLRQKIEISNFKVPSKKISSPVTPNGTYKTWEYYAENVHDFAFTTDPTYRIGASSWNGIICIALAQEQNAHAWQPTAEFVAKVIKVYSEDFGMYAYPKMVAADARDGMEYPMLTLDGGNWPGHQYVIAHEIGHNWFFGMVGNNETYRAALDEGFTQFLTAWSIKKINKNTALPNNLDWAYVYAGYINHAINENTARLNIHSDHFNSAERHGGGYGQVYYKTATMLYNLQYVLGDELFLKAMKHYFNQWKFCHPYEEDFRNSIIDYTKVDLNWFFDAWLTTTQTIDYKVKCVKKVKGEKGAYDITFKRKGEFHMPLEFTVTEKSGANQNYLIPNTYFAKNHKNTKVFGTWQSWDMMYKTHTVRVNAESGIRNVRIDTSGRLADINRLNNSLKTPVAFRVEKAILPPLDFFKYQITMRPDIWYTDNDGLKVGLVLNSNYYNFKHIIYAAVWYSPLAMQKAQDRDMEAYPLNYVLNYKTRVGRMLDFTGRFKYLEGISLFDAGLEKTWRNDKWSIGYKAFGNTAPFFTAGDALHQRFYQNYALYSNVFKPNAINATLNLSYQHPFRYRKGNSVFFIGLRNASLFSNYNYSGVNAKLNSNNPLGKKLLLKSRVFAQYMSGDIAPESALYLAGANSEELIENKYTRSQGWVPSTWVGYGNTGVYPFHMGGGLNIRGMAGYLSTNSSDNDTFTIISGNKGAAINLELEFGKLFKIKAGKLGNIFRLNPYLFADAGILGNQKQWSGLRTDAGIGTTLTIGFGKYNRIQPIVLRFDLPLFLNRVEPGGNYVAMRYVIGINRAF